MMTGTPLLDREPLPEPKDLLVLCELQERFAAA
jgi:hypothetical protein